MSRTWLRCSQCSPARVFPDTFSRLVSCARRTRFLAGDVGKELETVLDDILRHSPLDEATST